jgi:Fic family protein
MRLFEQPYLTANDIEEMLDVSGTTAYRAIHSLEEDGVLEEVTASTGRAKSSIFWNGC